ncbi:MAG TPA: hypothetical protein VF218_10865 [Acidothermaceae bacterium]
MIHLPAPRSGATSHQRVIGVILALWSFAYAGYRAYYAAGGTFGMIGEPVSAAQFRAINAFGSVAVALFGGVLPLVALRVRPLRQALPALGWIGGVGCCMHALVDVTLRLFSVTGVHPTQLPASAWRSFDRRAADLQDLLLNEPWFFVAGLLWAALGLVSVRAVRRRAWAVSAVAGCLLLTVIGILSGLDVIGSFVLF